MSNEDFFRGLMEQLEKVQQKTGDAMPSKSTKRELLDSMRTSAIMTAPPPTAASSSPAPTRRREDKATVTADGKKAKQDPKEIGRAVQQECRDRSRMPSSA
eukprot:TRINITY_DN76202_c0_g1_i1.p1 TRINITY_DN76202_c0_g1~~TRINITY_DN76202_c0_g1_i1.p1  ORF type:complete len:101 (+),score=24.90 TRINITY_DN76202_c0_g1_i1:123-425(+)